MNEVMASRPIMLSIVQRCSCSLNIYEHDGSLCSMIGEEDYDDLRGGRCTQ